MLIDEGMARQTCARFDFPVGLGPEEVQVIFCLSEGIYVGLVPGFVERIARFRRYGCDQR